MTNAFQERIRERVACYESGLITLSDEELLMLVLSPTGKVSTRSVTIARRILRSCTLQEVLRDLINMPVDLLRFGLSMHEVVRLRMAYDLVQRCTLATQHKTRITTANAAESVFRAEMQHLDHEELHLLVLDTKNQIVEYCRPYKGTVNSSCLRTAELFRQAIVRNCPSIIVAHNHPSGDPQPSPEDLEVTRQLVAAGKMLDIELLDHLILGNTSFRSLKELLKW